jgi:hypothetical protein
MLVCFFICMLFIINNKNEVSFFIDDSSIDIMRDVNSFYNNKINIYSSKFYLSERVRINTNFMIGSCQKVIYLNYPFTFTNDSVSNAMKSANSSGIVILKDQSPGVTAANLDSQNNIVPIAYFTLQELPIGWSLYTPADYYQQEQDVTKISLYNKNIYIGRVCGPLNQVNLSTDYNISSFLNKAGRCNVVLGNDSGNFNNDKLLSYNTIVGCYSGNLNTGSFNSFFGSYHGDKKIINPNYLNQDYYSNNDYSNYNNSFGFGNYNLTHSTGQGLKFLANKQNNVFGNLNFSSIWRGYRNCIFGNRILTTEVDNITQFNWIDSNIIIGNNILYQYNNNLLNGFYGNMIFIPNGDLSIYGGIEVSKAFGPIVNNNGAQCNYTIMIGSCGLPIPYQRSYKTFIANIYNSSLIKTGAPLNNNHAKILNLGNLGSTTFPVTVMINNADQLGQMELLPYRNFGLESYDPNAEPGNVTDLDYVVNFLLDPRSMPVVGVAFENTAMARKNGLLFTVDAYSLINNASILQNNPLASFVIYTAPKSPVPYTQSTGVINKQNVISANTGDPTVAGYEHYYLIPLLVRACQILNSKINIINNNNFVCGNLTAASQSGEKVVLGNSSGSITINGKDIHKPLDGNAILMLDSSSNIVTGDSTKSSFTCDALNATSLNTSGHLNAGDSNLGSLMAARNSGQEVVLGNTSGFITLLGKYIKNADKDDNSLLMINQYGNVWTGNTARGTSLTFGTLTCGNFTAAPDKGQTVTIGNNEGSILMFSRDIASLLVGVPLYIAPGGVLTTAPSSKQYKKNISSIDIPDRDIDMLNPVSFQYKKEEKNIYYGFLAEDINNIPSLKNTVVFNDSNEIQTINYNSIFVAIFSYLLKKQKVFEKEYNSLALAYKNLFHEHNKIKIELENSNNQIEELKKDYSKIKEMIIRLESLIGVIK